MNWLHHLIGTHTHMLWWQMSVRAVFVFFYLLVLVRFGARRAFGRWTPFDIALAILLGSTLSRTLTGNAPFLPTLAAAAVLVLLHVALAWLTMYWNGLAIVVKGDPIKLVEHGQPIAANMRRSAVSDRDLREQLRGQMKTDDLEKVEDAYLEPGGTISFIPR